MKRLYVIRRAKVGDLPEILELNLALFKKECQDFDKSLNLKWTYGGGKSYLRSRIQKKDGLVVVVESKGRVVGYLCGALYRRPLYRQAAKYADLENMFVKPSYRGQGAGSLLTQEFIKWCKAKGVKYVSVKASERNLAAIKFYRQNGFVDYDLILEQKLK